MTTTTTAAQAARSFFRSDRQKKPAAQSSRASPTKPAASTPPATAQVEEDVSLMRRPPPTGAYHDYALLSSGSTSGFVFDIMKFDARKPVPFESWQHPVKLNRKHPPARETGSTPKAGKITPMLGQDGNVVISRITGEIVMQQDGRPIIPKKEEEDAPAEDGAETKPKVKDPKKRKPFQKKTKQIHTIPDEQRQLQREERHPWLLEDGSGNEVWTGRLDGAEKGQMHGMFVMYPNDNNFYFLPAHRWYKFQKRASFTRFNDHEEVEAEYARMQKAQSGAYWANRNRVARQANEQTLAAGGTINLGHIPHQPSLVRSSGTSSTILPGGRKFRVVVKAGGDEDDDLFGDDDEELKEHLRKRRQAELGQEGDLDELEHEEDFSDDEEQMQVDDVEDLDQKEAEERVKKESRLANRLRDAGIDDDDDEDLEFLEMLQDTKLTGAGKGLHKTLRTHERGVYDSDDDDNRNPYLSSEDEEEEEVPEEPKKDDKKDDKDKDSSKPNTTSRPSGNTQPSASGKGNPKSSQTPRTGSRANSPPVPHGRGNSFLAHRATSPKGKSVTSPSSRAASPKPMSGHPGRATSPLAGGSGTRALSPVPGRPQGMKRKADESASGSGLTSKKIKRPDGAASPASAPNGSAPRDINEALVVGWLRKQQDHPPTTGDTIAHFKRFFLGDKRRKEQLAKIIKHVAEFKGGRLFLKEGF
ncbi:Rap30/74 interaction domain-containing protein [Auriculariales sp. MPI-PUGE-AT-0066]|nr:Rap30/74 interaction domain-containing protein [Auriculariales sp. MPI-PUGE-AT-0066]